MENEWHREEFSRSAIFSKFLVFIGLLTFCLFPIINHFVDAGNSRSLNLRHASKVGNSNDSIGTAHTYTLTLPVSHSLYRVCVCVCVHGECATQNSTQQQQQQLLFMNPLTITFTYTKRVHSDHICIKSNCLRFYSSNSILRFIFTFRRFCFFFFFFSYLCRLFGAFGSL